MYTANVAEEDLQVTAQRLATLFEELIGAWVVRESLTERLEAYEGEGPLAPPQQQPVEDLLVLAQHAHAKRRHDRELMEMITTKEVADKDYEEAAAALVVELVPENISGPQPYLSIIRPHRTTSDPDVPLKNYVIDVFSDTASVRLHQE